MLYHLHFNLNIRDDSNIASNDASLDLNVTQIIKQKYLLQFLLLHIDSIIYCQVQLLIGLLNQYFFPQDVGIPIWVRILVHSYDGNMSDIGHIFHIGRTIFKMLFLKKRTFVVRSKSVEISRRQLRCR